MESIVSWMKKSLPRIPASRLGRRIRARDSGDRRQPAEEEVDPREPVEEDTESSEDDETDSDDDETSTLCSFCQGIAIPPILHTEERPCCAIIEHAQKLLSTCILSHDECKTPAHPPLPPRVLDVGVDNRDDPFLLETEGTPVDGDYIALSYCWGAEKEAFVVTTSSNLHERKARILLMSLPKTLRHAVYITRRLSIRYLWIDALCIIQGSVEDWTKNSAKMGEIYGNATLTLSASGAASCTKGILLPRLFRRWQKKLRLTPDDEPIYHRAWTLQERLLSRRYLSFGTENVAWQCRTPTQALDVGKRNIALFSLRFYHLYAFKEDSDKMWAKVVIDYSSRYLTNESDKLPALSGIAQAMQSYTGDEYFAGLWRSSIFNQLLWRCSTQILKSIPHYKPKAYRAPSWSWASVDGNIAPGREGMDPVAEFVDCTIEPLSMDDPFGRVKSGKLVIRGPMKQASGIRWQGDETNMAPFLFEEENNLKLGGLWPDIGGENPPEAMKREWETLKLWCLQIVTDYGLLLTVVEQDDNIYQRFGVVYLEKEDWFDGVLQQTITII